MIPDQMVNLSCKLWPTSVQIKKGHCIRVSIAGADDKNFDRIPKHGKQVYTVFRNGVEGSYIVLPIIEN